MKEAKNQNTWHVYIVRCADQTLYTGITTNISRRLKEHNGTNKGAKYTRSRQPVTLVYSEICPSRSIAGKREFAIKQLPIREKEQLVSKYPASL